MGCVAMVPTHMSRGVGESNYQPRDTSTRRRGRGGRGRGKGREGVCVFVSVCVYWERYSIRREEGRGGTEGDGVNSAGVEFPTDFLHRARGGQRKILLICGYFFTSKFILIWVRFFSEQLRGRAQTWTNYCMPYGQHCITAPLHSIPPRPQQQQ